MGPPESSTLVHLIMADMRRPSTTADDPSEHQLSPHTTFRASSFLATSSRIRLESSPPFAGTVCDPKSAYYQEKPNVDLRSGLGYTTEFDLQQTKVKQTWAMRQVCFTSMRRAADTWRSCGVSTIPGLLIRRCVRFVRPVNNVETDSRV